jgi:hypothetical protein
MSDTRVVFGRNAVDDRPECPRVVQLLDSVVACELPDGHPYRGQPVHTATVYGVVDDRSVPVLVKWIYVRDPAPRTQVG